MPAPALAFLRLHRAEALLLGAVAFAIACEAFQEAADLHRPAWYLIPAAVLGAALIVARRSEDELRPAVVAGLSLVLYLGFFLVHRATGPPLLDIDISSTYPRQGDALLDSGDLPRAEYPPAAVSLFALAEALGPMDIALPLLTLPLLLAAWYALASSGRGAPWIVACVALWPTLPFFWEVKFDAVPTALFVLGMVAASRERWGWAGVALGFGAAVKWWPLIAGVTLGVALLRRHDLRSLGRLAGGAVVGPLATYGPFVGSDQLWEPYRFHAERGLIGESLPFLPLHLFGVVDRPDRFYTPAGAPEWADTVSFVVVAAAVGAVVFAAWRRPSHALPLAALSVLVFFLLNRVFSAQFMLAVAAAWACMLVFAGTRLDERALRWFLGLFAVAATANYAVYPVIDPRWIQYLWIMFAAAIAATVVVVRAATRSSGALSEAKA